MSSGKTTARFSSCRQRRISAKNAGDFCARRLLFAVATTAWVFGAGQNAHATTNPYAESLEVGANEHYAVVVAGANDSYQALAMRYLGDAEADWIVRQVNHSAPLEPGSVVVVPKQWNNKAGVSTDSYQVVPVLVYHHFGPNNHRLSVSQAGFREQLEYLRSNNYRVIKFADLTRFLAGEKALPPKSVVITIDDGYRSAFETAFPLLREFGYPATMFVYSDFLNKGGLKTAQLKQMHDSGLIDIQPHSKTHRNMAMMEAGENHAQYTTRIRAEIEHPQAAIERLLGVSSTVFAFPYGATTAEVVEMLANSDYRIGATVQRGGNAFFAHPFLLKRTMIYNEHDLEDFAEILVSREPIE